MATKSVTGKVTDAANAGVKGVVVKAFLSQGAVVSGTSEVPPFTVSATSASDGTYSLTLHANNDLTPNGTYYRIDEGGYQYNIVVPQSAGPFPISTIQVDVPPLATPSAQHVASLVVDTSITAGTLVHAGTLQVDAGPLTLPASSIADSALSSNVVLKDNAQTLTGVKSFSAAPIFASGFTVSAGQVAAFGTGDNLTGYNATTAQLVDIRRGTSGTPDTSPNPVIKISRYVNLNTAQVGGAGVDEASGLLSVVSTGVTGQVQVIGVTGFAFSSSTDAASADASGGYFVGQTTGTSQHVAIGLFGGSRIESTSASAKGSAIQLDVRNDSGFDHAVGATSFSPSDAIWITTNGTNLAGVGIELGNPFSQQFDVGLHFNGQVSGGLTGPTKTNDILVNSNALTSLRINGTHTVAIAVNAGTAPVIIGGTALQATAGCLLEVQGPASDVNPLVSFGSTANTKSYRVIVRNASGQGNWIVSGGVNNVLTGTAAGDTAMVAASGSKFFHIGGSVSVIKVGNANTLGFFNVTAVAQQATTGTATGFTAGGGTAVTDASTFTGGTGATAYRISDIVLALKNYGLMAA